MLWPFSNAGTYAAVLYIQYGANDTLTTNVKIHNKNNFLPKERNFIS